VIKSRNIDPELPRTTIQTLEEFRDRHPVLTSGDEKPMAPGSEGPSTEKDVQ
jgi:hypothetical protein